MRSWQCRCGTTGEAMTESSAFVRWLIHARRDGCTRMHHAALMAALTDRDMPPASTLIGART